MKNTNCNRYDLVKRWLDILGSAIAIVITAPLLAIVSLVVKLDGGPVLFRQERVSQNGRRFTMLKIRTMIPNAHDMRKEVYREHMAEQASSLERKFNDPRITGIGYLLRLTNLDELPQLLNILRGDMSLVGPRPVPYEESLLYGDQRDKVLTVRPGLTGYWQIRRRLETDYEQRVSLDCYYVENRSFSLDAYIFVMTPFAMFTSDYNSVTKSLVLPEDAMVEETGRLDVKHDSGLAKTTR